MTGKFLIFMKSAESNKKLLKRNIRKKCIENEKRPLLYHPQESQFLKAFIKILVFIWKECFLLFCFSRMISVVIYLSRVFWSHWSLFNHCFMLAEFAELLLHLLGYFFCFAIHCFIMCGGIIRIQKYCSRCPILHIVWNIAWTLGSWKSIEAAYARKFF